MRSACIKRGVIFVGASVLCVMLFMTHACAWPRGIDLDTLGTGALKEKNLMRRRILREVDFIEHVDTLEESDFSIGEEFFKRVGFLLEFLGSLDSRTGFFQDFDGTNTEKYLAILKYNDIVAETRKKLNEKGLHEHAKLLLRDAQSNQKTRVVQQLKSVERDDQGAIVSEELLDFEPEKLFIISDYNTTQRMQQYGAEQVYVQNSNDPEVRARVSKDLMRTDKRVGRRYREVAYAVDGAECVYEYSLKASVYKKMKAANAIGWRMKGDASFVDIIIKTDADEHVYSYVVLSDEWRNVIVPFLAFSDGAAIQWKDVRSFKIVIDGDKQENPEGVLSLDDCAVYMLTDDELKTVLRVARNGEHWDSTGFVKTLYDSRVAY